MLIRMSRACHYRKSRECLHRFAHEIAGCSSSNNKCVNNPHYKIIGDREIVGYGMNGNPTYLDFVACPFPAIRYRECTPELMALREKERGDWRKLTIDEKKYLYRASFRQTFSEMQAPDTQWKAVIGATLIGISIALWYHMFIHHYVLDKAPDTFSPEHRIAQYYMQVAINNQPISGNYRPPGAELRVHPKNEAMLKKMKEQSING